MEALYVHIPFCVKKCLYCDFNSYADRSLENEYITSLIKEINSIQEKSLNTVFIGGGTPTILSMRNLDRLLGSLERFHPHEFSIESNPGTMDMFKIRLLRDHGVNRLSIGLQAWQDTLLKKLGRIHTFKDFALTHSMAREEGFKNINVDLMFDIPGQRMQDWEETVKMVALLGVEHISCYSLIVEEGTPFYSMWEKGELAIPGEDEDRQMYYYAEEALENKGYDHYEISNFAKPGFECKHNIVYWQDKEYIGAGAGAHGYVNGVRYSNLRGVRQYIDGIKSGSAVEEKTIVTPKASMEEFMFLGLRMMRGVSKKEFKQRFNVSFEEIYGTQLEKFTSLRLLKDGGDRVSLTPRGIDISNQIFEEFML